MRPSLNKVLVALRGRDAAFHFNYLVAAALAAFFFTQLRWEVSRQYAPGSLVPLAMGTAEVPFQFRALVPWAVSVVHRLGLSHPPFDNLYKIYHMAEWLSAFLLFVAYRGYLSLFVKGRTAAALSSLLLLYPLSFNFLFPLHFSIYDYSKTLPSVHFYPEFINLYYPYDTPSVLFFTVGLTLIYKKDWRFFYPLLFVATLNRETTCFLTFVYLFTNYREERPGTLARHALAQLGVWVAAKGLLFALYGGNPGEGLFATKLWSNLKFLSDVDNYPFFLSNMGFLLVPVLVFWRRIREPFLRRSLLVLAPFFLGMMFVGNIMELRVWGEMVPVVLTAFVVLVREPNL